MALSDPQARPPRTMDELRAEALRLFPDDMPADRGRKVGLSSIGRYTPEQLRGFHMTMFGRMMQRSARS